MLGEFGRFCEADEIGLVPWLLVGGVNIGAKFCDFTEIDCWVDADDKGRDTKFFLTLREMEAGAVPALFAILL